MAIDTISFGQLWSREWAIKKQIKQQWLYPLGLFLLIIILFPLAIGTEDKLLHALGVPAVWIACLLAQILGVEKLFQPALENGTLAQLVVSEASIVQWVLIRLTIHWSVSSGLIAISSLLSVPLFGLSWDEAVILLLSIIVATPFLLMLSALTSSLLVTLRSGGVLIPIIALPLQLPVLIFATGAVDLSSAGMNPFPILALLLAGSMISIIFVPWIITYTLKLSWLN